MGGRGRRWIGGGGRGRKAGGGGLRRVRRRCRNLSDYGRGVHRRGGGSGGGQKGAGVFQQQQESRGCRELCCCCGGPENEEEKEEEEEKESSTALERLLSAGMSFLAARALPAGGSGGRRSSGIALPGPLARGNYDEDRFTWLHSRKESHTCTMNNHPRVGSSNCAQAHKGCSREVYFYQRWKIRAFHTRNMNTDTNLTHTPQRNKTGKQIRLSSSCFSWPSTLSPSYALLT